MHLTPKEIIIKDLQKRLKEKVKEHKLVELLEGKTQARGLYNFPDHRERGTFMDGSNQFWEFDKKLQVWIRLSPTDNKGLKGIPLRPSS